MTLVKLKVCTSCFSPHILYSDCICTYDRKYPTIELEFEQCDCCGNLASHPADTPFNDEQMKTLNRNYEDTGADVTTGEDTST